MNEKMEDIYMKAKFISPVFVGAIILFVPITLAVFYL